MPEKIALPLVAQQMFNTPLMIEPGKAAVIADAFAPRIFGGQGEVSVDLGGAGIDYPTGHRSMGSILNEGLSDHLTENRSGYIKHRGVAVIQVIGSLVRRGSWIGQPSGQTSYEGLRAQLKAAAADSDMKAIALEFDSPGGEAAGCFELADLIREIRDTKPVYAFLAETAYSAAYCLASQCNRITLPEYGGAGSIGVIMMHADYSAKFDNEGVKITIIRSGPRKAEGNSLEPLPEHLKDSWTTEAEQMRVTFADVVGKGRGDRLDLASALQTESVCFTGAAAVSRGLCDQLADPKKAFDAMVEAVNATGEWNGAIPSKTPIGMSSSGCANGSDGPIIEEEADMPDKTKQPDAAVVTEDPKTKAQTAASTTETADPGAQATARAAAITKAVAKAGLKPAFAVELIEGGASLEEAQAKIIDRLPGMTADGGDIDSASPGIVITGDGVDRMKAGMVEALCQKAGLKGGKRNEFSSMSLREMARHTLTARGLIVPAGGAMGMVGAAFMPSMAGASHGTSDFGSILADVANKSLLRGFEEAPENFEMFTRQGTLSDFKPSKRVGLSTFGNLDEVDENAEFKYGTVGDYGETIILATYGKLFAITRQAVINDDLGAFTDMPMKMGRAAKRTIGALVYAVINGNPAMSDGIALFHADHGNLAAAGAGPSEATIDAGLTAMATQKARGSKAADNAYLNIQPKYLLASIAQRAAVLQALLSEKSPDDTKKTGTTKQPGVYNSVYKAAEPIFDARITGNQWFLAADPNQYDTIEVAYLDGITEPYLEQQEGWSIDGTEFKVRIDAGVAATAWEGLYKNPGA